MYIVIWFFFFWYPKNSERLLTVLSCSSASGLDSWRYLSSAWVRVRSCPPTDPDSSYPWRCASAASDCLIDAFSDCSGRSASYGTPRRAWSLCLLLAALFLAVTFAYRGLGGDYNGVSSSSIAAHTVALRRNFLSYRSRPRWGSSEIVCFVFALQSVLRLRGACGSSRDPRRSTHSQSRSGSKAHVPNHVARSPDAASWRSSYYPAVTNDSHLSSYS